MRVRFEIWKRADSKIPPHKNILNWSSSGRNAMPLKVGAAWLSYNFIKNHLDENTCSRARVNQVLMITSRRVAWKFLVVLTLIKTSSREVWGFVVVVVEVIVVIDNAPSKMMESSLISLPSIIGPASVFPSSSKTDLRDLSGHRPTKVFIQRGSSCSTETRTAAVELFEEAASVRSMAKVENENKMARKRACKILLSVKRIFETW